MIRTVINNMLNNTCVIFTRTGKNEYGENTYSDRTEHKCYIESTYKLDILNIPIDEIQSDTIIYILTKANIGDRVFIGKLTEYDDTRSIKEQTKEVKEITTIYDFKGNEAYYKLYVK